MRNRLWLPCRAKCWVRIPLTLKKQRNVVQRPGNLCSLPVAIHYNSSYACTGRDSVYDSAVIGAGTHAKPVDLVDMEFLRVKSHVQVAAIKTERFFFEI